MMNALGVFVALVVAAYVMMVVWVSMAKVSHTITVEMLSTPLGG